MSQTVMRSVSSNFVALVRGKGGGRATWALGTTTHMSNSVMSTHFFINPSATQNLEPGCYTRDSPRPRQTPFLVAMCRPTGLAQAETRRRGSSPKRSQRFPSRSRNTATFPYGSSRGGETNRTPAATMR